MVGIEGNIRNAKVSVRVSLHLVDVVTDRIFNANLGARHSGFRRIRDCALNHSRIGLGP